MTLAEVAAKYRDPAYLKEQSLAVYIGIIGGVLKTFEADPEFTLPVRLAGAIADLEEKRGPQRPKGIARRLRELLERKP
ncbi:MAG: hypothetical protein ACREB9_07905 [Thermoplasmata archaeon]